MADEETITGRLVSFVPHWQPWPSQSSARNAKQFVEYVCSAYANIDYTALELRVFAMNTLAFAPHAFAQTTATSDATRPLTTAAAPDTALSEDS